MCLQINELSNCTNNASEHYVARYKLFSPHELLKELLNVVIIYYSI